MRWAKPPETEDKQGAAQPSQANAAPRTQLVQSWPHSHHLKQGPYMAQQRPHASVFVDSSSPISIPRDKRRPHSQCNKNHSHTPSRRLWCGTVFWPRCWKFAFHPKANLRLVVFSTKGKTSPEFYIWFLLPWGEKQGKQVLQYGKDRVTSSGRVNCVWGFSLRR